MKSPAKPGKEPAPAGRERRAHPRAVCDGSISLQLEDGAHRARLRDVSRAGICFFLDRPLREMTILSVVIQLPTGSGPRQEPVEGRGVVVRCQRISKGVEHYEIALFLNDLTDSARERLDTYVASAPAL